jgi:hypothetical protein
VDLDLLQIAFRAVLALVAVVHFIEGAIPKKGVTWQLPLFLHFQTVSKASLSFLVAFTMMVSMDLSWTPEWLIPDIGLILLIEVALLNPPINAVSEDGIVVGGARCPWTRYLQHDSEPLSDGYHTVRLKYRTWKFMSTRRFVAPEKALRAMEAKGRVREPRARGWRP